MNMSEPEKKEIITSDHQATSSQVDYGTTPNSAIHMNHGFSRGRLRSILINSSYNSIQRSVLLIFHDNRDGYFDCIF